MFQSSLSISKLPQLWKVAEIIPVINKNAKVELNDLRSVSLTSTLAKSLERIVLSNILPYVKPKLYKHQFAYSANRWTSDAIATLAHYIQHHLEKHTSNYVRCLFIDYSSASTTI